MLEETARTMELIAEVASCCDEAHAGYLTGGLIPYAVSQRRVRNFPRADVYVLAQHVPALYDTLAGLGRENRAVEFVSHANRTKRLSFRYIDTTTTFIDSRDPSENYQGIYVEVQPLLNEDVFIQRDVKLEDAERECEGFAYGGYVFAGGSRSSICLEYSAIWGEPLCFQNAHGKLRTMPADCIGVPHVCKHAGYDIMLPDHLDRYCEALYGKGENISPPSYPQKYTLLNLELPFSEVKRHLMDAR